MTYVSEVLADAPVAYWRLGDSGSVNPPDSSGNALHISTVENSPAWGAGGAIYGDTDWAYDFDANDSLQRNGNALFTFSDVFTIECWIKRKAAGVGALSTIFCNFTNSFQLFWWTDNTLNLALYGGGNIAHSSTTVSDTTTWHHIVCTKNGATTKLYIDGVDVTVADTNSTLTYNSVGFRINATSVNTASSAQLIDEFAFYTTALSATRVGVHYAWGATPQILLPDADIATTGWSTTPLFSKVNDSSDATIITATAS